MSSLRAHLRDYLRIRRRLGFELKDTERDLERFVAFCEQAGAQHLTVELALTWARLPASAHPYRWRRRLGVVRGFARYLATIDPLTEVPAEDLLPARLPRVAPYIYSPEEVAALLAAARQLTPALRAATIEAVIGLMASSGLRRGEALALDRHDVDLDDGALHVRAAKQSRQREVPLHATTTQALREYARVRDRHWPTPPTPGFFITTSGARLTPSAFSTAFVGLIKRVGLEGGGQRRRPRAHDLRHAFAVCTLVGWYRSGEDVGSKLPPLSTYLGHYATRPTDTGTSRARRSCWRWPLRGSS